ncbi:MAG: twin transmembrane helix small protein [Pseudomonadota bacterium]|nr:twin transmembrane helix small protein [Pseudomonadota bacterium]
MLTKIIIVLFLLLIVGSLFSGLFYLVRDKGSSDRAVKALTVRISLSVLLFILLMIGYATGVLQPHGVTPG